MFLIEQNRLDFTGFPTEKHSYDSIIIHLSKIDA